MGQRTLPESTEDTSLGAAADTQDGGAAPRKGLDRLGETGWQEPYNTNAESCTCHGISPRNSTGWRPTGYETALQNNTCGTGWKQVGTLSQKRALEGKKANPIPGSISSITDSRFREVIISLNLALVRPDVQTCVQFWLPSTRHGHPGWVWQRATDTGRGLEHRAHGPLSLFRLWKRLSRYLPSASVWKKWSLNPTEGQEATVTSWKTRNSDLLKKREKKEKNKQTNQNTKRVVKHWNGLSREVVETPYLKMLKPWLERTLSNLL